MRGARGLCLVVLFAAAFSACDDSTGIRSPVLVGDTVTVAAPLPQNANLPQALDVTSSFGIRGGRFPERARDALEWDFAVRIQDGEIVLVPAGMLNVDLESPPAITPPLVGQTIETLREAPGQSTFRRDMAMPMQKGSLYAVRTRQFRAADLVFGGLVPCTQFAKMEPVEVDVEAGILSVYIVTNENCGDLRLAPE